MTLRPTGAEDEPFLWQMLFYASHSHDEPGIKPEDIRNNPDLVGYIEGWRLAGMPGVISELDEELCGAAWLRVLTDADRANPVFVDAETPELAVAVVPGLEGRGIGTAMIRDVLAAAKGMFPAVVLSSRAENPAVRLYQRLGFRVANEMTNRVGTKSVKMVVYL